MIPLSEHTHRTSQSRRKRVLIKEQRMKRRVATGQDRGEWVCWKVEGGWQKEGGCLGYSKHISVPQRKILEVQCLSQFQGCLCRDTLGC